MQLQTVWKDILLVVWKMFFRIVFDFQTFKTATMQRVNRRGFGYKACVAVTLKNLNFGRFLRGREDVSPGASADRYFKTWAGLFISGSCGFFLETILILIAFLVMIC